MFMIAIFNTSIMGHVAIVLNFCLQTLKRRLLSLDVDNLANNPK